MLPVFPSAARSHLQGFMLGLLLCFDRRLEHLRQDVAQQNALDVDAAATQWCTSSSRIRKEQITCGSWNCDSTIKLYCCSGNSPTQ
jgi:hypothetical protein